jgi:hypothetical protein
MAHFENIGKAATSTSSPLNPFALALPFENNVSITRHNGFGSIRLDHSSVVEPVTELLSKPVLWSIVPAEPRLGSGQICNSETAQAPERSSHQSICWLVLQSFRSIPGSFPRENLDNVCSFKTDSKAVRRTSISQGAGGTRNGDADSGRAAGCSTHSSPSPLLTRATAHNEPAHSNTSLQQSFLSSNQSAAGRDPLVHIGLPVRRSCCTALPSHSLDGILSTPPSSSGHMER